MTNKLIFMNILAFLLLGTAVNVSAQINDTQETKVIDALAVMPVQNLEYLNQVMEQTLALGEEGILDITERLLPSGEGDDVQVRFLLHSLAVYSGYSTEGKINNNSVERAFVKALDNTDDAEIKKFLMRRLAFCGTNYSVSALSEYVTMEGLYETAISTLTSIGTEEAAKAIFLGIKNEDPDIKRSCVKAMGDLHYVPAVVTLQSTGREIDRVTDRFIFMALSEIADASSYKFLLNASHEASFKVNDKEAIIAFSNYGQNLLNRSDSETAARVGEQLLKNCTETEQLQFRANGIDLLARIKGSSFNGTLIKEFENNDKNYRGAVLYATRYTLTDSGIESWITTFDKLSLSSKFQFINTFGKINNQLIFDRCLAPSVKQSNESLSVPAINRLTFQEKSKSLDLLFEKLNGSTTVPERAAIETSLLRICSANDENRLVSGLPSMPSESQEVIVRVLEDRRAKSHFDAVLNLTDKGSPELDQTVYGALGSLAGIEDLDRLFELLNSVEDAAAIKSLQRAIIEVLDESPSDETEMVLSVYQNSSHRSRILPVMVCTEGKEGLKSCTDMLSTGSTADKSIALNTLGQWRNNDAIPYLYGFWESDNETTLKEDAFTLYLKQVSQSTHPDDQKLLLIEKMAHPNNTIEEKALLLRACGDIHTFLSLIFVSGYLEDEEVLNDASDAAINIALPTPTFEGLSGNLVKDIVFRSMRNLTGEDSQYLKIDVKEYLENMPADKGFMPIFNGKDLTGWKGLVDDPVKRAKLSEALLADKQRKADLDMEKDWVVSNGRLTFVGEGFKNICTDKKYGDFELLVDWKIGKGGDSGVYLRGTPQVQIWDNALTKVGAEVGSGGLYNNTTHPSKPLVVADNPIEEWNSFRIKMKGDVVTVHLNGQLVTDEVVLENYWNRDQPLSVKEAIELQAHGEDVEFRNIYLNELSE